MSTTRTLALALAALLASLSCGDDGGGNGGGDFVGSCTEAGMPKVCVDYYKGYTTETATQLCASTNDNFDASNTCATVNAALSKVPGRCQVVDHTVGDRVSDQFYYGPDWNLAMAKAHCAAYPTGYTATWYDN